jgi:hypothetical protein
MTGNKIRSCGSKVRIPPCLFENELLIFYFPKQRTRERKQKYGDERMNCRSAGHVLAMALAVADITGLLRPAMGQGPKPETPRAQDREPGRSSPPDLTPYVRPVIPEDRMRTPKPESPQVPDRDSARSSPPDITPYVRPVIPEDRMGTPLPRR